MSNQAEDLEALKLGQKALTVGYGYLCQQLVELQEKDVDLSEWGRMQERMDQYGTRLKGIEDRVDSINTKIDSLIALQNQGRGAWRTFGGIGAVGAFFVMAWKFLTEFKPPH